MKKIKLLACAGAVTAFLMFSCSKGPAGSAGPAGATGPAGPDSVVHSDWITLAMIPTDPGDTLFYQEIPATPITQEILDSGLVLSYVAAYVSNPSGSGTSEIVENASDFMSVIYTVGNIEVDGFPGVDFNSTNGNFSGNFRYVVIPGKVLAESIAKGYSKAQIGSLSFDQATQLFGSSATVISK